MTDIKKLIQILKNQDKSGIKTGDWDKIKFRKEEHDDGDISIVIDSAFIGFVFSRNGQFKYIYNWKE